MFCQRPVEAVYARVVGQLTLLLACLHTFVANARLNLMTALIQQAPTVANPLCHIAYASAAGWGLESSRGGNMPRHAKVNHTVPASERVPERHLQRVTVWKFESLSD